MTTWFGGNKGGPVQPTPPPNTPTRADAIMPDLPTRPASLISTGSAGGLQRKATTKKRSLIG